MGQPRTRIERIRDRLTSIHWDWRIDKPSVAGATVCDELTSRLTHINASSWKARLVWGGVYLNGRRVSENQPLPIPCRLEYYEPKFDFTQAERIFPPFLTHYVVYRDKHIIVVYKPAGLPSLTSREQSRYALKKSVEEYLGTSVHMPSRLDWSVRGLVVMSCSPVMHPLLQELFERRKIEKVYLLQTHTNPQWEGQAVQEPIGRDETHPVLRRIDHNAGKSALTEFQNLCTTTTSWAKAGTFLLARPKTGRTHQIRVHAASVGCPVIGDVFYDGAEAPELRLASIGVRFRHPLTHQMIACVLPDSLRSHWIPQRCLTSLQL